MALPEYTVTYPNQQNGSGDTLELAIIEFTGTVESIIARKSVTEGRIPVRSVRGTSTISNYNVGQSALQALVPGVTPDGTVPEFSRNSVTVDTVILARAVLPTLDVFQTQFDARAEIAMNHGKEIAKFKDQALLIQATKAGLATSSSFGATPGFSGGSQIVLGAAGDENDPAKLFNGIGDLLAAMEEKDVDPQGDDLIIAVAPSLFYKMVRAEQIVSGEYITSEGNTVKGMIFQEYGIPIIRSNNVAKTNVTGHKLSNTRNSNAYDGDFSSVLATVFSPRAILAGQTIPLTGEVFWDQLSKSWFVDSYLAFAAGQNRNEFAGVLQKHA